MTDETSNTSPARTAKVALALIGTIVLGAIGSGIWEVLFRPGLSRVGSVLTSISARADQAVFTTAALDPTPVAALVVLLFFLQIPALMAMWFIFVGFLRPGFERRIRAKLHRIEAQVEGKDRAVSAKIMRSPVRRTALLGASISLLMLAMAFYAFSIENKAVIVWRVFHQNLDICRQYMAPSEQAETLASFRRMKGRRDFDQVAARLDGVAKANGTELDWLGAR